MKESILELLEKIRGSIESGDLQQTKNLFRALKEILVSECSGATVKVFGIAS